jgi:hypothetical protein
VDVGFCSLDRQRRPLTGLELRGCWVARPAVAEVAPNRTHMVPQPPHLPARGFVPLDDVVALVGAEAPAPEAPPSNAVRADGIDLPAPTSLFGDQAG